MKYWVFKVDYAQDLLHGSLGATTEKQAIWRTDPTIKEGGGATGYIGTHVYKLTRCITGLKTLELVAD